MLLHFGAVAGDVVSIAEALMRRRENGGLHDDDEEFSDYFEIDSIHDCLAVVFEGRAAPAESIIHEGGALEPDGDCVVLAANELPALVALMAGMDFDALLDERIAEVEETFPGPIDEDIRDGMREDFEALRSFYARASVNGLSVIKWW